MFFTEHGLLWLPGISDMPKGNKVKGFSFHWMGAQGFIADSFKALSLKTETANVAWKLYAKLAVHLLIHCMCLRSFSCTKGQPTSLPFISYSPRQGGHVQTTHQEWQLNTPNSWFMPSSDLGEWHLAKTKQRPGWQFSNMVMWLQGLGTLLNTTFSNTDAAHIFLLRLKPHHLIASYKCRIKILSPCLAHA